jgi:uncharacterized protein (DUF2132 family)
MEQEKKLEEKKDQPNNAVHGVKLRPMLVYLEKELGWEEMGKRINITSEKLVRLYKQIQ